MPSRIIREGILTSDRVNALSAEAEVFYRRMMSVVDDFGRYYARPALIRAACFPLKLDRVSDSHVVKWLRETEKAGLIRTYEIDNKGYLELLDFRQQVRTKVSKYPACATQMPSTCAAHAEADAQHPHTDAHLVVVDSLVVVEDVSAANGFTFSAASGSFVGITEEMYQRWSAAYPAVDVKTEVARAAEWLIANPANRKRNYPAFIVRWMAKSQDRAPAKPINAAKKVAL